MFTIVFLLLALVACNAEPRTTEIVWMVDDSYSISRRNYNNAKKLILDVNDLILSDDRYVNTTAFGLLEFGSRITGAEPLTYDYDAFKRQVKANRFGSAGQTRISTAFEYANEHLFNENKTVERRVVAIVTDGAAKPGAIYGGPALVKAVNETFEEHELDRLVYIMVENSIGQRKANPNQFKKVEGYYNKSEDFISFKFNRQLDEEDVFDVFCMLVNCNNETMAPTMSPTLAPTTPMPTTSPTESPTNSPSLSPTKMPTPAPTDFTFPPGWTWPPNLTFPPHSHPHTHPPHEHDHDHDNGMTAGAIAGIVLGVLALVLAIAALAYTIGNDNN